MSYPLSPPKAIGFLYKGSVLPLSAYPVLPPIAAICIGDAGGAEVEKSLAGVANPSAAIPAKP